MELAEAFKVLAEASDEDWQYLRDNLGSVSTATYDATRRGLRDGETELRKRDLKLLCIGCGKTAVE